MHWTLKLFVNDCAALRREKVNPTNVDRDCYIRDVLKTIAEGSEQAMMVQQFEKTLWKVTPLRFARNTIPILKLCIAT